MNKVTINTKILKNLNVSTDFYKNWLDNYKNWEGDFKDFLDLPKLNFLDKIFVTVCAMGKKKLIKIFNEFAKYVLYLYENKYPDKNIENLLTAMDNYVNNKLILDENIIDLAKKSLYNCQIKSEFDDSAHLAYVAAETARCVLAAYLFIDYAPNHYINAKYAAANDRSIADLDEYNYHYRATLINDCDLTAYLDGVNEYACAVTTTARVSKNFDNYINIIKTIYLSSI